MIISKRRNFTDLLGILPIIALCVDLFTPFFIWKGIIPESIRWGSHLAVLIMIVVSFIRMLVLNKIPQIFWIVPAISIIGSYVAFANGQGLFVTLWGLWVFFQFPLVAFFIYLQPKLPNQFPADLRRYGLIVLAIQVAAQLLQYALGQAPGDQLSGLYGESGTTIATFFAVLMCCVYFGYWIMSKHWEGLAATLVLSLVSNSLAEVKLFPAAITILGILAILIYARKHSVPVTMLLYLVILYAFVLGFMNFYNKIVPSASSVPIETYINSPEKLREYLFETSPNYIARGDATQLGWNSIQKDPMTFLFGYGIGTRSESKTFGTVGVALSGGNFGTTVGTSFLIIIQEMGLVGLLSLGGLFGWIVVSLIWSILKYPLSPAIELRYALVLFSVMWPVWLWYANIWTMRVPMLIYWLAVGYVFAESNLLQKKKQDQAPFFTI